MNTLKTQPWQQFPYSVNPTALLPTHKNLSPGGENLILSLREFTTQVPKTRPFKIPFEMDGIAMRDTDKNNLFGY